uniref:Uncharacterized protein n=1 Tax=Prevotella sp. GTC17260 TaxID=3236796 RepID=A0AB33JD75_9BACT
MKRKYMRPTVEEIHIIQETALLVGSENDHADAKKNHLIWEEEAAEDGWLVKHANMWED